MRSAQPLQPVPSHEQVVVLTERTERQPQPEAVRQGDFLLRSFAFVQFALHMGGRDVVRHVLRQQVATIGGGVD